MTDDAFWVKDYYAAWDTGDVEAICAWFDEDVVWRLLNFSRWCELMGPRLAQ